jgi:hypothetical protein
VKRSAISHPQVVHYGGARERLKNERPPREAEAGKFYIVPFGQFQRLRKLAINRVAGILA